MKMEVEGEVLHPPRRGTAVKSPTICEKEGHSYTVAAATGFNERGWARVFCAKRGVTKTLEWK